MPKFISDSKEGIEYLDNLSPKRLSSWAKGTLTEGKTLPILLSGHTEPDELLLNFGKDSILGRKIQNAISGLVSAWDISEGTAYLSELLYLVGGGVKNTLLNQFTANALDRPVVAGPSEATAVGNLLVQAEALGELRGVGEIRQVVRNSFPRSTFQPEDADAWKQAFARFEQIIRH